VPIPTPSGWYSLGQTPLRLFDIRRRNPFLFNAGDHVRFRRIDASDFERLAALSTDAQMPFVLVS
jgi:allophanate hydrolase subunit 1